MKKYIIAIGLFFAAYLPSFAQVSDSLQYSIGIDVFSLMSGALNMEGEYKVSPVLGLKVAGGVATQRVNVPNANNCQINGLFLKGGANVKIYNAQKNVEAYVWGAEFVYSMGNERYNYEIPYTYGTYKGSFRDNFTTYGGGFFLTKVIRFHPRLYMDVGPKLGLFKSTGTLATDRYIPGGGPVVGWGSGMFSTVCLAFKGNLRYRF